MKNKLSQKFVALVASILTIFATATAVSACYFFFYQPKEPKCLQDK